VVEAEPAAAQTGQHHRACAEGEDEQKILARLDPTAETRPEWIREG
jgi:hypothetical protein